MCGGVGGPGSGAVPGGCWGELGAKSGSLNPGTMRHFDGGSWAECGSPVGGCTGLWGSPGLRHAAGWKGN